MTLARCFLCEAVSPSALNILEYCFIFEVVNTPVMFLLWKFFFSIFGYMVRPFNLKTFTLC